MKYRQPGYRDSEFKDEREKRRDNNDGPRPPRGPRGMEREARLVLRCFQCGHQEAAVEAVATGARCPTCTAAVHCCRNCVHFDSGARFECREPIPAKVMSKIIANECASFRPSTVLDATGRRIAAGPPPPSGEPSMSPGRAAFEALFKKK
jgi:hypothetical protein